MSIESWSRGTEAAETVSKLMAGPLGWDATTTDDELAFYLERVRAERASQEEPDDASADRVRLEAPDIVATA